MILGSGVDIVQVKRIESAAARWGEGFLSRIFTNQELDYCRKTINRYQHLAGRFASKEAVSQALKIQWAGGISWRNIEIINDRSGRPQASLRGEAKAAADQLRIESISLSISHCRDYAVAVVLFQEEK